MPYLLHDRLVVGVAASALFDLAESDRVFRRDGEEAYRHYQEEHLEHPLQPGIAFSLIKRLLSLNNLADDDDPLVEVIVMSRNDPDTGLRVMESIEHHGLPITRESRRAGPMWRWNEGTLPAVLGDEKQAPIFGEDDPLSVGRPCGL